MKKTRMLSGIVVFTAAVLLNACSKETALPTTGNDDMVSNEATASFVEKSLTTDEDVATLHRGPGSGISCNWQEQLPPCAVVTESGEDFPRTISIDYGSGCTDGNNITKSGIIHISLSDDMVNTGATRTVTFENFYINTIHIEGSRITTNTGLNESGQPVFSRTAEMIVTDNSISHEHSFSGTVTWISGFDTEECGDNVFSITGSGTCTRANGNVVTRTIVEPLIMDHTCGYITSGIEQVTAPMGTRSINFGTGECDDIAVATGPNGTTHTIHLHQH